MENITWRRPAKIVSVVEVVFGILLMTISIWNLVFVWHDISIPLGDPFASLENFFAQLLNCLASASFDILVVRLILSLMHFWAAASLFQATGLEVEFCIALERARFWLYLNIVLLVIGSVVYVSRGDFNIAVYSIIIQGAFIFVVSRFRKELEMDLSKIP